MTQAAVDLSYGIPEEELERDLADNEIWTPEDNIEEDPLVIERALRKMPKVSPVKPSKFTGFAFRMPDEDGDYVNFSFDGRRHIRRCYDTPSKRVLLFCGRQVEKSTLLGNLALCYMCMVPSFKVLYCSPSATQTKTFSNDRIKEPIETSPVLKRFTTTMLSQNILEKQFINRSKITMRYAFLNADRTRGIPATMLELDEFQDILPDNIPVIEQCLSHAPEKWKRYIYAGTPKSLDNNLEYYRARLSTQGEWVVPCDSCGSSSGAGRYWNVLGEKNIGKKGLICERCGVLINPAHQDAQWAWMVPYDPEKTPFESYRIPQLMVPWVNWHGDILLNYERYSRDKFYNEVLGMSYDSGLRPLTEAHIRQNCVEDLNFDQQKYYRNLSFAQPVYMGIDWGTGENSYTVVVLATYVNMKFRIFYAHRFTGEGTSPPVQLDKICHLIKYFNVRIVGTDYGGGFDRNDHLIRKFGPERIQKFQHNAKLNRKVVWAGKLRRWNIHRTEVMSDIFNAIKRGGQVEFPEWSVWKDPFAQDMLNIYSEYSETQKMIVYKHSIDSPDDTFHAFMFCWLGSMLVQPRPDIIAPHKEDESGRMPGTEYRPVYQG